MAEFLVGNRPKVGQTSENPLFWIPLFKIPNVHKVSRQKLATKRTSPVLYSL